jgi:hypothetical protein
MNNTQKRLTSFLSIVALMAVCVSSAHAQWKISMDHKSPYVSGERGSYAYTQSASGGTPVTYVYNWLTQYNNPHVPTAGAKVFMPMGMEVAPANAVNVPWGGTNNYDEWKPVIAAQLQRKGFLTTPESLEITSNVHLKIDWDPAYGAAPAVAYFEGRLTTSQYKYDLPGVSSGRSLNYVNFVSAPYTPDQIICSTLGQEVIQNTYTTASSFAFLFNGNNTLMHSFYGETYLDRTELFPGDYLLHGGRTRIPINNGHIVISMGFHQVLEINPFTVGPNKETQSIASSEFRIMPASGPAG